MSINMSSEGQKQLQAQERAQPTLQEMGAHPVLLLLVLSHPVPSNPIVSVAGAPTGGQNSEGGALVIALMRLGFQEDEANIN